MRCLEMVSLEPNERSIVFPRSNSCTMNCQQWLLLFHPVGSKHYMDELRESLEASYYLLYHCSLNSVLNGTENAM